MKHTNASAYSVALKNGMKLVEEYEEPVNMITKVYAITRKEWDIILGHIPAKVYPNKDI